MLKQEKLDNILETVNTKGTITVKKSWLAWMYQIWLLDATYKS